MCTMYEQRDCGFGARGDGRAASTHLDNAEQHPVEQEPEEQVEQVHHKGVPLEEEAGRPCHQHPEQHALRERLQRRRVRDHGKPQLGPPARGNRSAESLRGTAKTRVG